MLMSIVFINPCNNNYNYTNPTGRMDSQYAKVQNKFPNQLLYPKIIPKGFPFAYKQWINDPLTGNKVWARNDIVRFNFMNSKRGTFDPYRSFIQITVAVDPNQLPVGLLQVDNSAHSFINQLVLYSNNRQIQRITQYSTLLAYLNDIGMNQFLSQGRDTQGLGYGCHDTMPFHRAQNVAAQTQRIQYQSPTVISNGLNVSTTSVFPTIGNNYPWSSNLAANNSLFNSGKTVKGHLTSANPCLFPNDLNGGNIEPTSPIINICVSNTGYANNFRGQYYSNIVSGKFPQTPQCIPGWETKLDLKIANGKYPFYFDRTKPYLPDPTRKLPVFLYGTSQQMSYQMPLTCASFGFGNMFSPMYTKGTFQPFISPTVPQAQMQNGVILPTKIPIMRRRFKIPLASSVIGCLIDPTSYFLIPLQAINDLLLQLTLDPYAMFTSGYNDMCQYDNIGMQIQQARCYNIERIQYKLHTYFFLDGQVQQYIKTSLYQQITVVNNFWSLGNQYQIQGGSLVNNTYIVGCSSKNLNQIACLFVANDYQKYSFCRKHFRLSNNIRRFWSKLAVQYWPPQPFKGNGGNPCSNTIQDDNIIFIQNIYWANNYMFSKNSLPRINSHNFAVNDRVYNPTNKQTFYPMGSYNNPKFDWATQSVNADTALGMPYLHQNRAVGKAAYVIVYTPFATQTGILQGIDVAGLSTFQVIFETQATNTFPRDQTLYIFCKSSVVVKYTSQGIMTFGR